MSHEEFSPNLSEQKHFVHGQINTALENHNAAKVRLEQAQRDVETSLQTLTLLRSELQKIEGFEKEVEAMEQAGAQS